MFTRYFALRHLCTAATVLALTTPGVVYAQAQTYALDIPAQDLDSALKALAAATGQQVVFRGQTVKGKRSNALKGRYPVEDAFAAMISGSGLMMSRSARGVVVIAPPKVAETDENASQNIVVTGSHIRGTNPISPVHTVSRKDIENSGYSQIGDVVRSLPENFSGGQNPGVFNVVSSQMNNQNYSNASTFNLRGIGSDATLVLLNGRRLAGDAVFQSSDISGIPLSAVQRIEIVADGASAQYGSDAVAGVANIIMRKNFNGVEISANGGGATDGGAGEQTYSGLAGTSSDGGYALINLEYSRQSALLAGQRSFLVGAVPETTLLQPQDRYSAFLNAGKQLTEKLSVSVDALYSHRTSTGVFQQDPTSTRYLNANRSSTYSIAAYLDYAVGNNFNLRLTGVTSRGRNNLEESAPTSSYVGQTNYSNTMNLGEASLDGTLFHTAAGPVKVAAGGGYRRDKYRHNLPTDSNYTNVSHGITYAYFEAHAPLVSPSESRTGLHKLELSASARWEKYSDFGDTTNPKIGLSYAPLRNLTLRGTWGTSFKAPSFDQMYGQNLLYIWNAADLGYRGEGTALQTWGGNRRLKPERSTSYTLGADYLSGGANPVKLSATYFSIDYKDRIVVPVPQYYGTGLSDPLNAEFIEISPSATKQAALFSEADVFYNFSGSPYDAASVVAVLYDDYQNATSQKITGIDISYAQTFSTTFGNVDLFSNATWTRLKQQTIPSIPEETLSGKIYNVPKFKARGGVSWGRAGFVGTAIVNFMSGETDTEIDPEQHISSWATVDASISYNFGNEAGVARGLKIGVSATNILNSRPPYAASPALAYQGIFFDSTNATAIGRVVRVSVTKAW